MTIGIATLITVQRTTIYKSDCGIHHKVSGALSVAEHLIIFICFDTLIFFQRM